MSDFEITNYDLSKEFGAGSLEERLSDFSSELVVGSKELAESRRQKAEGRKQKAESRRRLDLN